MRRQDVDRRHEVGGLDVFEHALVGLQVTIAGAKTAGSPSSVRRSGSRKQITKGGFATKGRPKLPCKILRPS
jgi:hypothetical protein